ncbi:Stk1 family PASTA domain-containing Ser/Thr kinase [Lactobacillus acetotolerans]|uniref:non-specific serine/threonine protein kinase n=1 Tax=Lactobacillus acetotolerans TaxID=1600 RepID=A0A353U9Y4_9LACO|nr:Stk1 family PASTA domain-containing Ser/Thr kinase [Lactobacillus acetotolerans]KRN41922.1 non-specific serine threonine protein kinase [Lactobacillus acetotolerans DSM 20749 = JCM 3825]MBN7275925.1 Stk1 family PASTA domain-containing Ser/Thr kinase [Lactobacillus acetotolerans]QFG51108.1 Stk1 family PASTA domain-containing Ser/Thr kinase [Lactobacillus acetotolerans]QGV04787.1 Stk1 family PASTA domain-containing Ser/Thr kinase [Lactobacillus acetotolerans]QJD73687.1 Stk1 family PASTA domai
MIDKGYLLGDRYRIIDTLGEGGMANVYLAEDIILQRKVAVKILRLDLQKEPQTLARFQREALATSELSHPNIVSVLDVGTDHGLPYMVMEYVDGPNLEEYIQKKSPLDLHEVIRIMDQILSAMTLAHKHNVIHRDLKPQNVLMDKKGNIKIADFGIAVALNQSSITQTNSAMGSVHYMSPEQTRGGLVTKQSDIYSLGIILYELITGKVPFNGDTPVAIALKHAQEPIPSIRKKDPKVPQALENVVLKATAKDPRDRYASAQGMKADLDTSLDPSRKDEPVFVPAHNINTDETIVLPGFKANGEKTDKDKANASDQKKDDEKKPSFWENIKKHKWWWILSGLAAIVIIFIMVFALNGRDTGDVQVPDVTNLTENSARNKLQAAGLEVGEISHKHSDSIDAGKIISTSPGAGDPIAKGKTVDLVVSNGAGMVKVPDMTGKDYVSAAKKLSKLGFDVIRKDQSSNTVAVGNIISQSIAAGVEVKPKQTTITLVVSKGKTVSHKKNTIKLKDLRNYSLKGAQDYAKDNHLTLQATQKYSDTVEKGMVISMSPEAGTEVESGSTITISVSKGPKQNQDKDSSVTKTFTVNYKAPGKDQSSSDKDKGNHVQIYISDDDHSLSNIYRDLYIKHDMSFSIPFSLKDGSGELRVVRDGQTVLNEKVTK